MEQSARNKLYKAAVEKWGPDAQMMQLIEEMSELTTAIMHKRRNVGIEESVIEEMADVEVMLEQAKMIINRPGAFKRYKNRKLLRLEDMLKTQAVQLKKGGSDGKG